MKPSMMSSAERDEVVDVGRTPFGAPLPNVVYLAAVHRLVAENTAAVAHCQHETLTSVRQPLAPPQPERPPFSAENGAR